MPRPAENAVLPLGGTVDCPSPSKGYNGHRRLRRGAASATTSGVPRSPWQGCANARRHQDRRKPSTTRPETGRWTMRDRVFVRRLRSGCRRSLIGLAALSLLAFSGCEARAPRRRPASRGCTSLSGPARPPGSRCPTARRPASITIFSPGSPASAASRLTSRSPTARRRCSTRSPAATRNSAPAGCCRRPTSPTTPRRLARPLAWSTGYHSVEPVLIYNVDGYRPRRWADLDHATVAYPAHTGLDGPLAAVRVRAS